MAVHNCSGNFTVDTDEFTRVVRTFFGYITLPISCLGLLLASFYVAAVVRAMWYRRVSKKCYILLLDRASGDILACLMATGIGIYVVTAQTINENLIPVAETLLIGTFWSSMISYVALSLLKLFAVARPLSYRHVVTLRRCIYLIIISWSLYFCLVVALLIVMALVKIPALNAWSGCRQETCTRTVHRIRHVLIIVCYFVTLTVFGLTVFYIRQAQRYLNDLRQRESQKVDKVFRFPLWKLGLNVATFALFYVFQVMHSTFILFNQNKCLFVDYKLQMWRLHGIIRTLLLLRIVVDPIVSFVMDKQLRTSFVYMVGSMCRIHLPGSKQEYELDENTTTSTSNTEATMSKQPHRRGTVN